MIGRIYLEHGQRVTVLARWAASPGRGAEPAWLTWHRPPRLAPRNVLIERADGRRAVRPFRGLRRTGQEMPR
jgi:hypothetical protein